MQFYYYIHAHIQYEQIKYLIQTEQGHCLYFRNNIMISRVVPLLNRTLTMPAFFFAEQAFRANSGNNREIIRLDACRSFEDVMSYVSRSKQIQPNELKQIFQLAYRFRNTATPWEKTGQLAKKTSEYDLSNANPETLSNICGLISLLSQNSQVDSKISGKLHERITEFIKEPSKLLDDQIINFIELGYETNKGEYIESLFKILKERMPNLKIRNYNKYLELASKRRFPTRIEKETWNEFAKKFILDLDKLEDRFVINSYKMLRGINKNVYRSEVDIVQAVDQRIREQISGLDEKEIFSLLNYQSNLNSFNRVVYNSVIDAIDDDGNSNIDKNTTLKLLNRIITNENFKLSNEKEEKVLKFISKNLGEFRFIIGLMKKNYFTRQQIIKLVDKISESEFKNKYEENYQYIYEIISRGINKEGQFSKFISSIKTENARPNLGEKYVYSALIVDRLLMKDRENAELKDVRTFFETGINEAQKAKPYFLFAGSNFHNKNRLLESFNKRYGFYFLNDVINKSITENKKIENSLLAYLFSSNSYRDVAKLLKSNEALIQEYQLRPLLEKVGYHANEFSGNYEFLNKLTLAKLNSTKNYYFKKAIINYVCNWEIHAALNSDEVNSFLKLARAVVRSMEPDKFRNTIQDFASYFIKSPNKLFHINLEYYELLNDIQQNFYEGKKTTNTNNTNTNTSTQASTNTEAKTNKQEDSITEKSPNTNTKPANDFITINKQFVRELMKYGVLSKLHAERILKKGNMDQDIQYYAEVLTGVKPKLSDNNKLLFALLRCRQFNEDEISEMKPQILDQIASLQVQRLEDCLLNFGLRRTASSFEILNKLIATYTEAIKLRDNLKLPFVLTHLESLNVSSKEYKDLLKKMTEIYTKNSNEYPSYIHSDLLRECLNKGVDCVDYSNKLIQGLESKFSKKDFNIGQTSNIIQNLLLANKDQALKLYANLLRNCGGDIKSKVLNHLILVDVTDEKMNKQIVNALADQKCTMKEGIFRYLSEKIPQLKNSENKIKFENANDPKWLREITIEFLKQKQIQFQETEKYGHHLIKIGSNYVGFWPRDYSSALHDRVREYYRSIFEFGKEADLSKIIILFSSQRVNKHSIVKALLDIPDLKNLKTELIEVFVKKSQNRNQVKTEDTKEQSQASETKTETTSEQQASKPSEPAKDAQAQTKTEAKTESKPEQKQTKKSQWQS